MEQYKALSDRIEKYAAESRSEVSRLHLDNQKFAHEIISLRKDKGRILLIRNFTIALIIVLAVVGYLYITRLRVSTKLRQQEAIAEKQKAEAEALKAKEQLQLFTESLREKTLLIESLQSRVTQKELQQQQIGQIEELTQYTILTDTDWDRFKSLFTKVYPGFFVDIKQRIPDITVAEQRMAALIKLRITIKDAAAMLGVSQNSIYKTRQRLRSRLGLAQDADLDEFFLTS